MKKWIALFLACVVACLCFSGCHGAQNIPPFEVPEAFDTSRNYEITFWAKNDTNMTQVEIYQNAITDFQALYPNITVNLRLYTDYGKIYNDVITNISTGTTPNVCITYPDHIATYLTGTNCVVPLDQLFSDGRYGLGGSELRFDGPDNGQIVEQFLNEGILNDAHYAIPYMRSTECCYVNKTFVEKLGYTLPEKLTWDFVWEVSEAAAAQDAEGNYLVNGQKVMIPFLYKSTDNMMIQMLRQRDAGYALSDGTVEIFNDDTRDILMDVAQLTEAGAFSTFKISSYPANFLNAGQCIFAVDSTAGATWMGCDAPLIDISEDKLVQFETVVMELPQYDTSDPKMISQGPSMCIFNKEDPQEVLASWLFAQYMLTDEVQIAYAQTEGYVPVTTKAQESAAYQDYLSRSGEDNDLYYSVKLDATQLLLDNIDNTFVTPVFNGSASLRDAAGQMIENVTKAVRRNKTVDDAFLEELYADVSSLYHLDQIQVGSNSGSGKLSLDGIPAESVALLAGIGAVWLLIGVYLLREFIVKKKTRK